MKDQGTQRVDLEKKYCPKCFQQFTGTATECPDDKTPLRDRHNDPLIGKVFADKYDIDSVLGLGGMSIVYKAKHRLMDRMVAIKMLHSNFTNDITALERFKLESQAASSLDHQNIIRVFDFGVTPNGEPYFVMDCLIGESLKEMIDRKRFIPFERALPIFRQIADALDAAHKKQIVHRDLKPANVILIKEDDGADLVKLVDFGIAKLLPGSGKEIQHLTQTGEVFGSPIYMSPEQCLGKELDTRSDIYAFGCLMYETLSGEPPLLGDSFLETMNKHVSEQPKPIAFVQADSHVPPQLEQIVFKCVAKDPADRFQTAGEIRDLIGSLSVELLGKSSKRGFISGAVDSVTIAQPCAKKASPWRIVASALGAIIVGTVAFTMLYPGPPEDKGTIVDKLMWQLALSKLSSDTASGDYKGAQQAGAEAERLSSKFGDHKVRLEATLRAMSDLYARWEGHAEELERVNIKMSNIQIDQIKQEFHRRMSMLKALSEAPVNGVAAADAKLKAEAEVQSIISTALKLHGRSQFEDEESLLDRAISVDKDLLDDDSISMARLKSELAECLIQLRKFPRVRSLLVQAMELRKNEKDREPSEYVRSLNRLGQYDLDQNDFTHAQPELQSAFTESQKLPKQADLQLLCMRSYADLMRQCGHPDGSSALLKQADTLEKNKAQ